MSLGNEYHMTSNETYSGLEDQAVVAGILMFHCTESLFWRPVQRKRERYNMLTHMVWVSITRERISHGDKRNLLGVRRSSGSYGSTYVSLHGKFVLRPSAKRVGARE